MDQKTIEAVYGGKIPKINLGQLRMMRDVRRIIKYLGVIYEKMPEECYDIVMVPIVRNARRARAASPAAPRRAQMDAARWAAAGCGLFVALSQPHLDHRSKDPRGRAALVAYDNFQYEEEAYDYDRWFADGFSAALQLYFKNSLAGYYLYAEYSDIKRIRKCMQEFCFTDLQGPLGYLVSDEVIEWLYCYRIGEKMKHCDRVRKYYG